MSGGGGAAERSPRDVLRFGATLALGMAIAFPVGLIVAGRGAPESRPRAESDGSAERAEGRQTYSPTILEDPYFRAEQRRNVEALEAYCSETGELCAEAEGARAWLDGNAD
jgi:hypothetical protein